MLYTKDREAIVKEAKDWIGTPYRACSRLKRFGCDCITFVAGVYIGAGYLDAKAAATIPKVYSVQFGLHQRTAEYLNGIRAYMREIPEHEVKPGDVVLYQLGKHEAEDEGYTHSAIVVTWPEYVIHATMRHGVVGAHGKNEPLFAKVARRFFTLGVE